MTAINADSFGPRGETTVFKEVQLSLYTGIALNKYGKQRIGAGDRSLTLISEADFQAHFLAEFEDVKGWGETSANLKDYPEGGYMGMGPDEWTQYHISRGPKAYAYDAMDKQLKLLREIEVQLPGVQPLYDEMVNIQAKMQRTESAKNYDWQALSDMMKLENVNYEASDWQEWWVNYEEPPVAPVATITTYSDDATIEAPAVKIYSEK